MPDVFLSYKREDYAIASKLAEELQLHGYTVFYDLQIPVGDQWDTFIERQLAEAKAVVVLWSPGACESPWVRREARVGARRSILCPAIIAECEVPLEFSDVQAARLVSRQTGDSDHHEWKRLLRAISTLVPTKSDDAPTKTVSGGSSSPKLSELAQSLDQSVARDFHAQRAPTAPVSSISTSWPRTAAARMDHPEFSLSAFSSGKLETGDCRVAVRNQSRHSIQQLKLFVGSIDTGDELLAIGKYIRSKVAADSRAPENVGLEPDGKRSFLLCYRDLKDTIGYPPWLLLLEGEDFPLHDERSYCLSLELRSTHRYPTLVRVKFDIGLLGKAQATIFEQTV